MNDNSAHPLLKAVIVQHERIALSVEVKVASELRKVDRTASANAEKRVPRQQPVIRNILNILQIFSRKL